MQRKMPGAFRLPVRPYFSFAPRFFGFHARSFVVRQNVRLPAHRGRYDPFMQFPNDVHERDVT